jgi:hypothetical protein
LAGREHILLFYTVVDPRIKHTPKESVNSVTKADKTHFIAGITSKTPEPGERVPALLENEFPALGQEGALDIVEKLLPRAVTGYQAPQ